jgi:hypothetical protein
MAAVQAEERVWRASVAEVSKVVGEMPREAEA